VSAGSAAGSPWNEPARCEAENRECDHDAGSRSRSVSGERREDAAGDRAQEDGDEGAGFDQRVAADQLGFLEHLGQERVLYRAEQRGLRADQKQRREEPAEIAREKTPGREHHHRDLEDFHPADQV
jgi:hypothetical protein